MEQAENGGSFYKTVERTKEGREDLAARIGVRVHSFHPFQQDHIIFLMQKLNRQLDWCRVVLVGYSSLFIEATLNFYPGQNHDISFISRERSILNKLKHHSQLINNLIEAELNSSTFLSQAATQETFESGVE